MSEKLPLVQQVERYGSLVGRRNHAKSDAHSASIALLLSVRTAAQALIDSFVRGDDPTILEGCQASLQAAIDLVDVDSAADDGFKAFHDRADTHAGLLH